MLTIRGRGREELTRTLERRGFERPAAEEAARSLERDGWLDDAAAARSFVLSRKGRYGRARIERELSVRGFDADVAAAALKELPAEGEEAALVRAWKKLLRSGLPGQDPRRRRERIARALIRRGFSAEKVFEMIKGSHEVD